MTSALTTLQQWLLFSSTILVVGCVAWRLRVAPAAAGIAGGDSADSLRSSERRVGSLALSAVGVLLVAWALRLVVQVMGFRDPFVPLMEDVSFLLFEIEWGTVWMVQGGVIVALGIALAIARPGVTTSGAAGLAKAGPAWIAALLLSIGLAATMSLSGHASGVETGRSVALTADALHTLAAGAWIGSLFVILAVSRDGASPSVFGAQIQAFSPMALASVGTLVAMGAYLAWQHLTVVSDLWTETYGRVLTAKIAVVLVIFALGFWNWRRGVPVSDTDEGARIVWRRAAWEVAVAVGVIFLTAILTHSPKP